MKQFHFFNSYSYKTSENFAGYNYHYYVLKLGSCNLNITMYNENSLFEPKNSVFRAREGLVWLSTIF